jgi:23S rRNA pseudouridine1911/1915/1917 synthase
VVHEDADVLIVDKPFGLPSQNTRSGTPGLYELLQPHYDYIGLHHRLDQPASGLILFSRNPKANAPLTHMFQTHQIQRQYACVLVGKVSSSIWNTPVNGKEASSHVTLLGEGQGLSAVQVNLHTGRKHQIRVQAALAGTPIAGDRRYGGEAARRSPRLALHASLLHLAHPLTGEPLIVRSPIPLDLVKLWCASGGPVPQPHPTD